MATLHVRFGSLPKTVTPVASSLICAAAEETFDRLTPEGDEIPNNQYEGDWDAEISGEAAEVVANWVVQIWTDSFIKEIEDE